MSVIRNAALIAGATAVAASVAFAGSHAELPASVKGRQAHMQLYVHNLGILGGMARGNTEYNADIAEAAASNLATLTTLNQMTYWEPGTDADSLEGTRAKPELWANIPDAIAKGEQLAAAAATLAENAGSLEGVQANLGAVGKVCGSCHDAYQVPNN